MAAPRNLAATLFVALPTIVLVSGCTDRLVSPDPTHLLASVGGAPDYTVKPATPTGLNGTAPSGTEIVLTWQDNSNNEHVFTVQENVGGTWRTLGQAAADVTTYAHSGLTPESTHTYRVRACNSAGCGTSAQTVVTTPAGGGGGELPGDPGSAPPDYTVKPATPGGLAAAASSSTVIVLTWQDRSNNEHVFTVQESRAGKWHTLAQVAADGTSFTHAGLTPESAHTYRVRACNSAGCGTTGEVSATTPPGGGGEEPGDTTTAPPDYSVKPANPTALSGTAPGATEIVLTWQDRSNNEHVFTVQESVGGTWRTLGQAAADVTTFRHTGLAPQSTHTYRVRACNSAGCGTSNTAVVSTPGSTGPVDPADTLRLVTFGDSNTDLGWSGTDPRIRGASYISAAKERRLAPTDPHRPQQLAGKIQSRWQSLSTTPVVVVNHGSSGTTTGGGAGGGPERHLGAPNARTAVAGVTRFEAEVLGRGRPWSGGEPLTNSFPAPIVRVLAYTPDDDDFAYVSMGTNDPANGVSTAQTLANLEWMVSQWTGQRLDADHLMLTTLPPRDGYDMRALNQGIRNLAARTGVRLIDLSAHTSADDGLTWRSATLHIGDRIHYAESVRDWLAAQVVAHVQAVR